VQVSCVKKLILFAKRTTVRAQHHLGFFLNRPVPHLGAASRPCAKRNSAMVATSSRQCRDRRPVGPAQPQRQSKPRAAASIAPSRCASPSRRIPFDPQLGDELYPIGKPPKICFVKAVKSRQTLEKFAPTMAVDQEFEDELARLAWEVTLAVPPPPPGILT
jgi:hypothetical protein